MHGEAKGFKGRLSVPAYLILVILYNGNDNLPVQILVLWVGAVRRVMMPRSACRK